MKLSITLLWLFIGIVPLRAQTIHSIIFANTFAEEKIASACKIDKDRVMLELKTISRVLKYELKQEVYADYDFSVENLKNSIGNLVCSPNDIVFFYFSGHGARAKNDVSDWPQLNLNPQNENRDENYFPLEKVDRIIKEKGARLTIVLGDCCNSASPIVSPKLINKGQTTVDNIDSPDVVYSGLFGDCAGNVLISSSSKGEFSLALQDQGGLFTLSYFSGVEKALKGEIQPNWNSVLNIAKSLTTEFTIKNNVAMQTPQYVVNVNRRDTPPDPPRPIPNDYLSALESLLDKSLTAGKRIQLINPVHNQVFTTNAIVETVGKDMKTILDREASLSFVKRIAISAFIVNINEVSVKKDDNGKISYLRVHETRIK